MSSEGPVLEALTGRLAECPADFLAEPRLGGRGVVHTDAVVSDLLVDLGGAGLDRDAARPFAGEGKERRNLLRLVQVASWLLGDPWFAGARRFAVPASQWLASGLDETAGLVAADRFVTDPERREELVRACLAALGLRPEGESEAQAQDRLTALSSVERDRVVRATQAQLEHARKVREAMRRKAAEEAAAREIRE
ncbi:MAG: hypothetical protein HY905_05800 [Deltaproteobacteria bacterium]|nr:hypothetical protein [Deltaproteobacteria bacterium]